MPDQARGWLTLQRPAQFVYLKESFSPSLDEKLSVLYEARASSRRCISCPLCVLLYLVLQGAATLRRHMAVRAA